MLHNSSPSAPVDQSVELASMRNDIKELGALVNTLINNTTIANETINNMKNMGIGHTPYSRPQTSTRYAFDAHEEQDRSTAASYARPTPNQNYNGLVKLSLPDAFHGKAGTNALQILTFIIQMEIYFDAVKIHLDSPDSLPIALSCLRGNALLWYDSIKKREDYGITSWNLLKEALLKRYQPMAQEQISLTELLNSHYKGSIENYNNEFLNALLMLPDLNNPVMDGLIMGIYSRGIRGPNTTFVSATVRNAITKKEVSNVNQLMSLALLTEQNMKDAELSSRSSIGKFPLFSSNNNYNRFDKKSFSSPRFARPNNTYNNNNNSFSSPQKLNNMNVYDQYYEDEEMIGFSDETYELNHLGEEHDEDNNSGVTDGPVIHDEPESGADHFLNALKIYDRLKQGNNSITPEEFDRRRRAGACYFCGGDGHMANRCPKKTNGHGIPSKPLPVQFPKRK